MFSGDKTESEPQEPREMRDKRDRCIRTQLLRIAGNRSRKSGDLEEDPVVIGGDAPADLPLRVTAYRGSSVLHPSRTAAEEAPFGGCVLPSNFVVRG